MHVYMIKTSYTVFSADLEYLNKMSCKDFPFEKKKKKIVLRTK